MSTMQNSIHRFEINVQILTAFLSIEFLIKIIYTEKCTKLWFKNIFVKALASLFIVFIILDLAVLTYFIK